MNIFDWLLLIGFCIILGSGVIFLYYIVALVISSLGLLNPITWLVMILASIAIYSLGNFFKEKAVK